MKDNMDRDIPYVSNDLCVYLRERFSLQNLLMEEGGYMRAERYLGYIAGINALICELEGIHAMQEENDGLRE